MSDNFEVIPVTNYRDLGMYLYRGKTFPSIKGIELPKYIDFEAVGKEYASRTGGKFYPFMGFRVKKEVDSN